MNFQFGYPSIRAFICLLAVCCIHWVAGAQGNSPYRQLTTAKNIVVSDTISGLNLGLSKINPLAKHGNVDLVILQSGGGGIPRVYRLIYTPDPGFVGIDTFALEYNYYGNYPFLTYRGFQVSVYPTLLKPRIDFGATAVNTPVTLNVLQNDMGSNPPLTITEVTSADHGTASIASNQVQFTPAAGYAGKAHFNYTVCDALGHCQSSSATVLVRPSAAPQNDTTEIYTAKNTPVYHPLTHAGYTIFQAPAHGTAVLGADESVRYTPNFNFNGIDSFRLVHYGFGAPVYQTFKVRCFNTPTQNLMAVEDKVFTPRNQAITFNVRQNDIGNLTVRGWIIPNNLPGTVSNTSSLGNVTFTPNQNFNGVATFYYKLGNANVPDLEIGTVHVVVSNLPPERSTYEFATPPATPVVLRYQIPFNAFNFSVTDPPAHGVCQFFPGFTTQNFGGQAVSGHNLLSYTPNSGFTGLDEFEINYCTSSNGQCQTVKITANVANVATSNGPYCIGDCVWTGDANNDGVVNNADLLAIGYYMGEEGDSRSNAALEWYGQYGDNWDDPFATLGDDLKFVDADGNGIIESADTLAISLFYGQTHQMSPRIPSADKGLPFFLNFLTPMPPQVGDLVEVEISLGSTATPATDIYGFTFDVSLSPTLVDSAFQMEYYPYSWLNTNAPYLTLAKRPRTGRFETAFTRTNGIPASGIGAVAKMEFIIVEIIQGARPDPNAPPQPAYGITFTGTSMNGQGESAPLVPLTVELPVVQPRTDGQEPVIVHPEALRVYPSPATDQLNVHLNGNDLIESLSIVDLNGKVHWQSANHLSTEHLRIDVAQYPAGIYVAVARTQSGQVVRKFEVVK